MMTDAERLAANVAFLDQGIAEGAEFVLSVRATEIKRGTTLAREVQYLLDHGYKFADDEKSLIPK